MTASGGNFIGVILNRNKRSVRGTVAPIEVAEMALTTSSGGNLVSFILNRNKRSPQWGALMRAVRENRDYGSAVRVRYNRRLRMRIITPTTASGGNFIGVILNRNKRSVRGTVLMRAVRENRDYGSAVRVRYNRRLRLRK